MASTTGGAACGVAGVSAGFVCTAADCCVGSGAGFSASGFTSLVRGGDAFGIGTVGGVWLATFGTEAGGRGGPLKLLIGGSGPAGRKLVVILIEIIAHPVRRHEANDLPGAGVDHQAAIVATAVDDGDDVEHAALPRNPERREPALANDGVDLLRRQQSRAVARHRGLRRHGRVGPAEVGYGLVRRTAGFVGRRPLRIRGCGRENQPGRHDPPCEQFHCPSLL